MFIFISLNNDLIIFNSLINIELVFFGEGLFGIQYSYWSLTNSDLSRVGLHSGGALPT